MKPQTTEAFLALKRCFGREHRDAVIVARYWHAAFHYSGQGDPLYARLCRLGRIFRPGPICNGPESGSIEEALYQALCQESPQ